MEIVNFVQTKSYNVVISCKPKVVRIKVQIEENITSPF